MQYLKYGKFCTGVFCAANKMMGRVNNKNTRKRYGICSTKLNNKK